MATPQPLSNEEILRRRYELYGIIPACETIQSKSTITITELTEHDESQINTQEVFQKTDIHDVQNEQDIQEVSQKTDIQNNQNIQNTQEVSQKTEIIQELDIDKIESQRLQDKLNAIDEHYNKLRDIAKNNILNISPIKKEIIINSDEITSSETTSNNIEVTTLNNTNRIVMPITLINREDSIATLNQINSLTNTLNTKMIENQLRGMMNSTIIDANYEDENDRLMLKSMYCDDFETDELMAFLDPNVQNYHIRCPNSNY